MSAIAVASFSKDRIDRAAAALRAVRSCLHLVLLVCVALLPACEQARGGSRAEPRPQGRE